MYPKTYYCCSTCNTPYENEEQVMVCEDCKPDPRYNNITKGDVIMFTEETFKEGKVEREFLVKGRVLGKYYTPGDSVHNVMIFVEVKDYVRGVLLNKKGNAFLSYSRDKYTKKHLENLDLR